MAPHDKLLDIHFLKSLGKKTAWFGLGFIQLKLDNDSRLHFWSPDLSTMVNPEEWHDHRYTFTSHVLAGNIRHEVGYFMADENGDHELCEVACQPEHSRPPRHLGNCTVVTDGVYEMTKGAKYTFPQGKFHKGESCLAITYLQREKPVTEFARIIRPRNNSGWTCPFSGKMAEEDLWNAINDIIQRTR